MQKRLMLLSTWLCCFSWSAQGASIETVTAITPDETVTLGGIVVPHKSVELTAQVSGRVVYVAGVEGDVFEPGEIMVQIDNTALLAKRNQMMAELTSAQTALMNAQVQYNRELWSPQRDNVSAMPGMGMPGMFDQMFTNNMADMAGFQDNRVQKRADLYQQATSVRQAQAQVFAVQSQVQAIDTQIREAESVAPFRGIIVSKSVEAGDTVQQGQPLLAFVKQNALTVEVNVPVRFMSRLQKGDVVQAILDNGRHSNVRISQIYPTADSAQHTVKVKFDLPVNVPAGPGMYAEVNIPNPTSIHRRSTVVKAAAILHRGSLPSVYILDDTDHTVMRSIRLGHQLPNGDYVVMSGLRPGERVVVDPPMDIVSGMQWDQGNLIGMVE